MRTLRRPRAALGLIGIIVLAGSALAGSSSTVVAAESGAAPAKNHEVAIVQANIQGSNQETGNLTVIRRLMQQAPTVVLLQEVCQEDLDELFGTDGVAGTPGAFPAWNFEKVQHTTDGCRLAGSTIRLPDYNVIASPRPLLNDRRFELPDEKDDPDGQCDGTDDPRGCAIDSKMLCADVDLASTTDHLYACSVHLKATRAANPATGDPAYGAGLLEDQTAAVADALRYVARNGRPVVLAGDFNLRPRSGQMDNIYRLGRDGVFRGANEAVNGDFHEADQGDPTHFAPQRDNVTCFKGPGGNPLACRGGELTNRLGHQDFANPGAYDRVPGEPKPAVPPAMKIDHIFYSVNGHPSGTADLDLQRVQNFYSSHDALRDEVVLRFAR